MGIDAGSLKGRIDQAADLPVLQHIAPFRLDHHSDLSWFLSTALEFGEEVE